MLPWSSFDLHNFCTGFCEKMFEIECPVQEMQIYLKKKTFVLFVCFMWLRMMITIFIVLPCRSSSELLAVSVWSTLLWAAVLKTGEYLDKSWCQRAQITEETPYLMVFFIVVKGSKGTLYLTLAGGPKIMATVEEMMVVRARTTLTGTILQRAYYSEGQCFVKELQSW